MIHISKPLIGLMNIIIENNDLHDNCHITNPGCKNIRTQRKLDCFFDYICNKIYYFTSFNNFIKIKYRLLNRNKNNIKPTK
jgi:hypothetical protein